MRANDYEYRRNIENVVETICLIMEQPDALEGLELVAGNFADTNFLDVRV